MAKTIMVVDDDQNVRDFLDRLFSKKGYVVIAYSGAREAIGAIEDGRDYDLLLVDTCLRGGIVEATVDVTEATAVAQISRRINPQTRIINLCGDSRQVPNWRAHYDYRVEKPFIPLSSLTERVSSCLEEQ